MKEKHITDVELFQFWQQQLSPEEQSELLEHICDCEQCSIRMANGVPTEWQLTAPAYLKGETVDYVMQHTKLRRIFSRTSLQLLTYSLKVGVAMAAVLLLLLRAELPPSPLPDSNASVLNQEQDFSITVFLNDGTRYINQKLNEFSSNLLYKEDTNYEK